MLYYFDIDRGPHSQADESGIELGSSSDAISEGQSIARGLLVGELQGKQVPYDWYVRVRDEQRQILASISLRGVSPILD
jgi:hypothetical protein